MSKILITKQTAAATADVAVDAQSNLLPCGIVSNGLAGTEVVDVLISDDNGVTYAPLLDTASGLPVQLTATKNAISLVAPALYRLSKTVTVAAVGVALSTAMSA